MKTSKTDELDSPTRPSRGRILAGRILSGLVIVFLVMDAGGKLIAPQAMIDHSPALGIPPDLGLYRLLGGLLAVCTVLYALPRTAVVGAILLTGYLGGAIAVNMRAEMPLLGHTLFGVYVGAMVWAGLFLRNPATVARIFGSPERY